MHPSRGTLACLGVAVAVVAGSPAVLAPAGAALTGQLVVVVVALGAAVALWRAGGRAVGGHRRGWRLLSGAVLTGVVTSTAEQLLRGADVLQAVDPLRALAPVPGSVLACLGLLSLLGRVRARRTDARLVAEIGLFYAGSVVLAQLFVVAPAAGRGQLGVPGLLYAQLTVLAGAAVLSAGLTLIVRTRGARRAQAGVVLLALALLGGADGLATVFAEGVPAGATLTALSRVLDVTGLLLLARAAACRAVLRQPATADPAVDPGADSPVSQRLGQVGELLPYAVTVVAAVALVTTTALGRPPAASTVAAALACVVLAAVHRWATARQEIALTTRLRRSEAHFRSLVRSNTDGVLLLDGDGVVLWAAPSILAPSGADPATVVGRRLLDAVHPDDVPALSGWLSTPDPGAGQATGLHAFRLPRADGGQVHLEASATDLRADPDVRAVVLHCRDVTARVERETELTALAYTDAVTGLPNRAALAVALTAALEAVPAVELTAAAVDQPTDDTDDDEEPDPSSGPPAADGSATLLLLELVGLGEARTALGRAGVDVAVAEVGARLRGVLRTDDVVARFSEQVFAVLAHGTAAEGERVAARCLSVVDQPISTTLGPLDLAGDVGLAALRPGQSIEELVQLADLALAAAAEAGPGVVRQATASLLAARDRRDLLLRDLVGARARGELGVVYQPIVSLAEHRITGAEALVRWTHPLLGEIPPEEFLPIAERAGVLADLERWVLAEAATAAASLPDVGGPLRMGVDVSAGHVATGMLVGHVSAALARSGLAPERLVVEVSEAAVTADGDRLRTEFDALRLMGVRVGLDGFGAHTSGLSHLTRLPLDLLKIDRSFLTRIDRDATTRALCESTIRVSQALGFDVVAVGVESPSELAVLGQLGCGSAQGRLLARPMALSALHALVEERAGLLWPGLVGRS